MIAFINLLLGLLNYAVKYAHDKQLLNAGEASAIAKSQKELNAAIQHSIAIRRRTRNVIDELRNNPRSYRD